MRPDANMRSSTPPKISGSSRLPSLSLKPSSATIQPVIVVPRLAPKIMPSACGKLSNPAPTKPTAATVVALEDCRIAVPTAPVAAPLHGLRVALASQRLMPAPASAFKPSVMTTMPSRNTPMPPMA